MQEKFTKNDKKKCLLCTPYLSGKNTIEKTKKEKKEKKEREKRITRETWLHTVMGNTPDYYALLSRLELPHPKESRPLLPLTLKAMGAHSRGFKAALDWLTERAVGGRSGASRDAVRDAMRLVLMNLVDAMFLRCWIAVPGKQESYNPGGYLHDRLHLSARSVKACLDTLTSATPPLVLKEKGYVDFFGGKNQCNKYFPTPDLQHVIWDAYVAMEEPIEPPYVEFKKPDAAWKPSQTDIDRLTKINEFMKNHSWAGKGPIRLIYSQNPIRGGRVYTRFSQLPMKKVELRINTLINGDPICEVDYVSNHSRMALVLAGYEPPADIYEDIKTRLPKPVEREKIKAFMNMSFGANDSERAFNACKKEKINQDLFNSLRDTVLNIYPRLDSYLFRDLGAKLQSLEGAIAIDIMLEGVKKNIPVLPVHDSFAVPIKHEGWLIETMQLVWSQHVSNPILPPIYPCVSMNRPKALT